jgi:hypothetical protein
MPINHDAAAFAADSTGLCGVDRVTQMFAASETQANDALREVRSLFHRTLASWASDMLLLQRRGLHQPTWETAASHRHRKAA